ncbi:hypothetical protein MKEN_00564200 [Mycena kentingensis (nom. inval.)]|nr:hypothetical protein MKEN_00564200 [Mycena kentingensis (nom. inval.)]
MRINLRLPWSLSPNDGPTLTLPAEIWRIIFRFAARSEVSFAVDYEPFEPVKEQDPNPAETSRRGRLHLATGTALSLVCRCFRAMVVEFLYEDVRICDARGLESLMWGLAGKPVDGDASLGSYVRRLEIPARRTSAAPSRAILPSVLDGTRTCLLELLAHLPNLEILVRPSLVLDTATMAFWTSLASPCLIGHCLLPNLRRLEWHETYVDAMSSGGLSLQDIINCAPRLSYLSLSSDGSTRIAELALPSGLRTVRLGQISAASSRDGYASRAGSMRCHPAPAPTPTPKSTQVSRVTAPASPHPGLRHLVLYPPPPASNLLACFPGSKTLRVLELAFAPQLTLSLRVLHALTGLEELAFHLGAPEITQGTSSLTGVKRVRVKVDPGQWRLNKPVLRNQVDVLSGETFPALDEVVLYDRTGWFLAREVGRDAVRRLVAKGCRVVDEDGEMVRARV